jgi:rubrerythrin
MARAYAIELEASERYTKFAEQLEAKSNQEVALLFRRLAEIEVLHAKQIVREMGWSSPPALPRVFAWKGSEAPETAPLNSLHGVLGQAEALDIALRCELRAQKYFEGIASGSAPANVRAMAAEMASEEKEHVRMLRYWMAKMPRPLFGWD